MLKGVTQTFIDGCNAKKLTYKEYIVLDGITIPINAKLSDDCYENGNFIGSFILKTIQFQTSNQYNFKQKEFEYYKVVNGESIKIGTFITTEIEDDDTLQLVKVIGMDYGLKTQVEYKSTLNYSSGEVTLLDVWNEACSLSGIESGVNSFANSSFIVDSDQFTGTGATIRDVFVGIALSSGSFIKVMNDDKIYPMFTEDTNEIVEDYTDLEDKRDTRPISCVRLGMSQVDGENVDLIDPDLVEEYGENWLILNDNPFAYNQSKREQLITAIFNKVKGFGYSAFTSDTSFKPFLTCGDKIKFRNRNGDLIDSILLRYTHEYSEDELEIHLEAPSETSATVNYVYPLSAIDITKRTQIEVDKANGNITLLTGQITETRNNLENNYYNIEQTNTLVQSAKEGLTNTFTTMGGNNILRNTGLWIEDTTEGSNKCNINFNTSYKGMNFVFSGSELYLNGTTFIIGYFLPKENSNSMKLKAGTYTISMTKLDGTIQQNKHFDIYFSKKNDDTVLAHFRTSNLTATATFTLDEDTEIYVRLDKNLGSITLTDLLLGFDIVEGDTPAPEYEPFYHFFEYWNGYVVRMSEEKAVNQNALLLQKSRINQQVEVKNDTYTLSFKYKRLNNQANCKAIINGDEITLDSNTDIEVIRQIEVSSMSINVVFETDTPNSCEIYDLMLNVGDKKANYSQNENETTTDTVKIGKGITITSSDTNATFKANSDGIRIYNNRDLNNFVTEFTDKSMVAKSVIIEEEANILDLYHIKVGNHTWVTKL